MINKENWKPLLGTWYDKLEPLFDGGIMDEIYSFLKARSKTGVRIVPAARDVYRCFEETPITEVKAVMMGMAPYHTIRNGVPVADGILMSARNTKDYIPPSLEKFYGGLEDEYGEGMILKMNKKPDLSYLAHEGVLMFNASLTTEAERAKAHMNLWKPFTKYLLEEVISLTGVPVIFLGQEAGKFKRHLAPMQWNFEISHPASASYNHTDWDTKGVFKKVQRIVKDMNGAELNWFVNA